MFIRKNDSGKFEVCCEEDSSQNMVGEARLVTFVISTHNTHAEAEAAIDDIYSEDREDLE